MKRIVAILIGALIALSLVTPAQAGTYFNLPKGVAGSKRATQYKQMDQFKAAVNAQKRGSRIGVAIYSMTHKDAANALCSADKRGVRVTFVTFYNKKHKLSDQMKIVQKCLKKPKTKGSSFKACKDSCSGKGDTMHHKFATFSPAKVMWSSGNFTNSAAKSQFVDWTWTTDIVQYNQANATIARMLKDKVDRKCTHTRSKRVDIEVWYYPCKSANPSLGALRYMKCNKSSKVYVGMYMIGPSAKAEITELLQCKKAGGDVRFIGNRDHWSKSRVRDMLNGARVSKKYKNVHIPVFDSKMKNGTYLHGKFFIIKARHGKKAYNVAFSGSYNWGVLSRSRNDNFTMIQRNIGTVNQFQSRFLFVQKYSKRVYKV